MKEYYRTLDIRIDENDKLKCPIEFTLALIGGKWKSVILWHLSIDGVHRYSELRRKMPGITHKMLSATLKELELYGFINRKQYNQMPPKVEYKTTEKGYSLMPIFNLMREWGYNNW